MPVLRVLIGAILLLFAPSLAQAADKVQVGLVNSITDILFRLPEDKGWYAEQGLQVAFTPFDSAAKMIAPLAAGQLDAGSGAISAGLFNAVGRGMDIRIVADKGRNGPSLNWETLLVRTDLLAAGQFRSLADLKGRKVAVAAPGIATLSFLSQAADAAGIGFETIDLQYLGFSQLSAAFGNGALDAAIGIEPYTTMIVQAGLAKRFGNPDDFAPNAEGAVLLFGPSLLKARRDAGGRFMNVYRRMADYYMGAIRSGHFTGPRGEEIITAMAGFMHVDPEIVREMHPFAIGTGARVDKQSLAKDFTFFQTHQLLNTPVLLESAIDTSFLDMESRQ